jgi:hypothetical protein
MTRMDCAQLKDAAPELALGILPGDERAAALAHLDDCPGCREEVSSLAGLTDQLLVLTPRAEPSPGFEQRVLASLATDTTRPACKARARATRPIALAGLALVACIALTAVLWWGGRSSTPSLATAPMRTDTGAVVGQVYLHRDAPAVLSMSLPGWADRVGGYGGTPATYELRIERRDGPAKLIPMTMSPNASWATTLDVDPDAITTVAVLDSQGRVWCRAQFATVA